MPRSHAYVNAQNSLYIGKTASDKKGPRIQYQVKTGKPNSMSSHEMTSDCSGDLPPMHPNSKVQQSFDAYQLGTAGASSSLSQSGKAQHRNAERLGIGRNQPSSYHSQQSMEYSHEGGSGAGSSAGEPRSLDGAAGQNPRRH